MIQTEPEKIEMTPEMRERLDRFLEVHGDDALGPVATSLLFEDERVRIWEMKLEPGEASAKHRHDLDYYLAIFQGDVIAAVSPKGSSESFVCRLPEAGNTVPLDKGGTEWAFNVGNETFREIMVELKDT